jgi:ribonuclease HI
MKRIMSSSIKSAVLIKFDGGANGNPGVGGSGCVVQFNKTKIKIGVYHTFTTNNEAEYKGLLLGLSYVCNNIEPQNIDSVTIKGDSLLVVNQCLGTWKCKALNLQPLLATAKNYIAKLPNVTIQHIPRAENGEADELSNVVRDLKNNVSSVSEQS